MTHIGLKKIYSGKVRDLYEIDDKRMLMVASDRLSAFDVILDDPIPGKGEILTAISNFWFGKLAHIMPNHFTGQTVYDVLPHDVAAALEKRAVVAKRLEPLKIEAIVRGYLAGSGWKEYRQTGAVCGIRLPENRGFALHIEPVEGSFNGDKAHDAQIINRNVENWVRRFPEQYLFAYNRYKHPAGAPLPPQE